MRENTNIYIETQGAQRFPSNVEKVRPLATLVVQRKVK